MLLAVKTNTISKTREADQVGIEGDIMEAAVSEEVKIVRFLGQIKIKIEPDLAPIRVEVDFSQIRIRTEAAGSLRIKTEVGFSQIKTRAEADLLQIRAETIKTPTKIVKDSTHIKTAEDFILTAEEAVAVDTMEGINGQT